MSQSPRLVLVKHNDKWRGDYYLKNDLTFTTDRSLAARFSLEGISTILNRDHIRINLEDKSIAIDGGVRLLDRARGSSFIITDGSSNARPIIFGSPVHLMSSKEESVALKYQWGATIAISKDSSDIIYHKLHDRPRLITDLYKADEAKLFEFILEPEESCNIRTPNLSEGGTGIVMIVLLIILLVLFLIVGSYSSY